MKKHSTDDMRGRCKESGRLAQQAGIARSNCIFAKGSESRTWWLSGWDEAYRRQHDAFNAAREEES